jgi:hypothetical protein
MCARGTHLFSPRCGEVSNLMPGHSLTSVPHSMLYGVHMSQEQRTAMANIITQVRRNALRRAHHPPCVVMLSPATQHLPLELEMRLATANMVDVYQSRDDEGDNKKDQNEVEPTTSGMCTYAREDAQYLGLIHPTHQDLCLWAKTGRD